MRTTRLNIYYNSTVLFGKQFSVFCGGLGEDPVLVNALILREPHAAAAGKEAGPSPRPPLEHLKFP